MREMNRAGFGTYGVGYLIVVENRIQRERKCPRALPVRTDVA